MRQKIWIPGADPSPVLAALTLPGVKRSVGHARAFVADTLVPDFLAPGDDLLDDVVLVVDELVGNAIKHTRTGDDGGRVTVVLLASDGVLRPEVTDDGGGGQPRVVDPDDESGRGLHIVEALSDRWGFRESGRRTTVWAEFDLG